MTRVAASTDVNEVQHPELILIRRPKRCYSAAMKKGQCQALKQTQPGLPFRIRPHPHPHARLQTLIGHLGIIGAVVGSLLSFKEPYRAVLINYLTAVEKDALLTTAAPEGSNFCND